MQNNISKTIQTVVNKSEIPEIDKRCYELELLKTDKQPNHSAYLRFLVDKDLLQKK